MHSFVSIPLTSAWVSSSRTLRGWGSHGLSAVDAHSRWWILLVLDHDTVGVCSLVLRSELCCRFSVSSRT
jgi:hypothetical protein